ncbi:MAG: hypothetical protein SFU57_10460 [Gemmatimonadales bacterium]|nr:hypothetical protein [Gemmatimonadales bacterium]
MIVSLVAACSSGPQLQKGPWADESITSLKRTVMTAEWDTLATRGGDAEGTLGHLWLSAADSSMFVAWDNSTQEVHAFDHDLRPLWQFGRKGAGPGEFRQGRSIAFTPAGEILIFDVATQRMTFLTRAGELRTTVVLEERLDQVVPWTDGKLLGTAPRRKGSPFVVMRDDGRVLTSLDVPWDGWTDLHPLLQSGYIASDPTAATAAFIMIHGDGWFAVGEQPGASYLGRYVEHLEMPSVIEKSDLQLIVGATIAGQAVSVRDGMVTILYEGKSPEARRWLDQYRLSDGSYLGSQLLPEPVSGFSSAPDGSYFVVFNDPSPTIMRLRPKR